MSVPTPWSSLAHAACDTEPSLFFPVTALTLSSSSKPDSTTTPAPLTQSGAVVTPDTKRWLDQARRPKATFQLQRYEGNPILSPNPDNPWEASVTTNPGAWIDPETNDVCMLYRAAGHDVKHQVFLGLARSQDGFNFERCSDEPVFGPSIDGFDAGCVEDPRVIRFGDYYYITYAARTTPPGQYWIMPPEKRDWVADPIPDDAPWCIRGNHTSTGLAITKDFKTFLRAGRLTSTSVDDRDVILFPEKIGGKYYMMHRPMQWVGERYGTDHPTMWISSGDDLFNMGSPKILIKAKYDWEVKLGGNTPPIRTEHGWLTLYHAVGSDLQYRLGALLLDLEDPTVVRHRTPDWILQPEADYETKGFYKGCIFPCGKVVRDGRLMVYYGAADRYVGVATCGLSALLEHMITCPA
jgi:beta-1,2-mannobiose phosphorylase / 1,2-beta-oligomannan phosphorylase